MFLVWNLPISACILFSFPFSRNVYSQGTLHLFHFLSTGLAQRSNSMATLATKAPMAKRRLRTRCMTPTWSQPRPKLYDSIPHSTQCVRWYSPTSLPLPAQWIQPTSQSRSVTWGNPAEGSNKQIIQTCHHEQQPCVVAYRSSIGYVGTATRSCSSFNLNDGTTCPRSPTEQNKLEPESPGVNQEATVVWWWVIRMQTIMRINVGTRIPLEQCLLWTFVTKITMTQPLGFFWEF